MSPKPVIFLSAVSCELKSARQLVANTLTFLGYEPDWQDIFGTEEGDLRGMLRRRIDASTGVVQIVGHSYGSEPPVADEEFGRVSYTQYEALYARECGKKVWILFLDDGFPADVCEPEPQEKAQLQRAYRERVKADDHLYHPLKSREGLEASVLKLRDDLTRLRRGVKRWAGLVLTLLVVLMGFGVWMLTRQHRSEQTATETQKQVGDLKTQNEKLLQAVRDLPKALSQAAPAGQNEDEQVRLARAYAALENKLHLPTGTLEKELPQFAEQLLACADTSALDRANAFFATRKFAEAEAEALQAKDQALAAAGQPVKDAIAALELAGQSAQEQIQYSRALEHFRAASALTSEERDPFEWAGVQWYIAYVRLCNGQYHEAEIIYRKIDVIYQRVLGPEDASTLSNRSYLAAALNGQDKYSEAENELRAVRAIQERVLGQEHPETLSSGNDLATALRGLGKNAEAERELRAVLAIAERIFGPEHPNTLASRENLALTLDAQGKHAEAESEFRAIRGILERVLGPDHPHTLLLRSNLADTLESEDKYAEAEEELRALLPIRERVLDREHPETLRGRNLLAWALVMQQKYREAEEEIRPTLETMTRVLGAENLVTLGARDTFAEALRGQGKLAQAEAEHRAILTLAERALGLESAQVYESCYHLALALEAANKLPEALAFAQRAEVGRTKLIGPEHPDTKEAHTLRERIETKLKQ